MAERVHIAALVDDEHGDRTDDVETGHQQDKGKEQIGHGFLNAHDVEHLLLLFHAVQHGIAFAETAAQVALDALRIGSLAQTKFQRGDLALLLEKLLGKTERREQQGLVILPLVNVEAYAAGIDLCHIEALGRIDRIDTLAFAGSTDLKGAVIKRTYLLCQPDARNAIVHTGGMKLPGTVAVKDGTDAGAVGVTVVHTFEGDHGGMASEKNKGIVLKTCRGYGPPAKGYRPARQTFRGQAPPSAEGRRRYKDCL